MNARDMLQSGFTTVRDVGNAGNYADTDLRRAIEEGMVPGPTVINAGRIITPLGGQYHGLQPERPDLGEPEYLYADTPEQMREAVRKNVLFGARVIKIVVDDQPYLYSVDDVKVLIAESARAGLKVAAHAGTEAGVRVAAEAGVASIEHAYTASTEVAPADEEEERLPGGHRLHPLGGGGDGHGRLPPEGGGPAEARPRGGGLHRLRNGHHLSRATGRHGERSPSPASRASRRQASPRRRSSAR